MNINFKSSIGVKRVDSEILSGSTCIIGGTFQSSGFTALSLLKNNGAQYPNIIVGTELPVSITTGYGNILTGENTGYGLTSGTYNIFMGQNAGKNTTEGAYNIFMGQNAGTNNICGLNNVFLGSNAGLQNRCGSDNISIGWGSSVDNGNGNFNIMLGNSAGNWNTGAGNIGIGVGALYRRVGQSGNVALGTNALKLAQTGAQNTSIGYYSGENSCGDGNVFLGYCVGQNEAGDNKLYIGNSNTTTPLIWGDFANKILKFNGDVNIGTTGTTGNLNVTGHLNAKTTTYNLDCATISLNDGDDAFCIVSDSNSFVRFGGINTSCGSSSGLGFLLYNSTGSYLQSMVVSSGSTSYPNSVVFRGVIPDCNNSDSGTYLSSYGAPLIVELQNEKKWKFSNIDYSFTTYMSGGLSLLNETPSSINPNVVPNNTDLCTGVGWNCEHSLALIAGGVNGLNVITSTGVARVEVNGDVLIKNAILSNQVNDAVVSGATEVIATIDATSYDAAFFDFVVKKGTNLRAGIIYTTHDGTNVTYAETSTDDLGDTSDVVLSVDLDSGDLRLLADSASDGWTVKSIVRGL